MTENPGRDALAYTERHLLARHALDIDPLAALISSAIPDELTSWRFRYSERIATLLRENGYEKREPVVVDDETETEDVCGNCNAGIPDDYRRQVNDAMVERAIEAVQNDRLVGAEAMRAALAAALTPDGQENDR